MSRKRLGSLLGAVMLLSTVLVGIAQPTAQAVDPPQVWDTSDLSPQDARVHGDGSVTITDCNTSGQETDASIQLAAVTYAPNGTVLSEIPKVPDTNWSTQTCRQTSVVGTDSTFYTVQDKNGWEQHRLVAYKNNVIRWSHAYACNNGRNLRPEAMTLGMDGNIYAVFHNGGLVACPEYPNDGRVLIGIDATDGSELFRQSTPVSGAELMYALSDKLVVKTLNDILFYSYSGQSLSTQDLHTGPEYGKNFLYYAAINEDDLLYVYQEFAGPSAPPVDPCPQTGGNYIRSLYLKKGNAAPIDLSIGDRRCVIDMALLPDDTIVYAYHDMSTHQVKLLRRDVSGATIYYDIVISEITGQYVYTTGADSVPVMHWISVSGSGDVYLKRRTTIPNDSQADRNLRIDQVSSSGVLTEVFDTSTFDNTAVQEYNFAMQMPDGGLGGDRLFVPVCKSRCDDSSSDSKMYVVDAAVGRDYPRSSIFAEHKQLNYVALGDSFSSGEGVEPFYEATEREDINECHRSKKAYPELLANTPGSSLDLRAFVACSGATTSNIINATQWDEDSPQYTALSGADVVTISIGGNDVSFADTITRCIIEASGLGPSGDCDDALDASEAQLGTLDVLLGNALDKIKDEIGSETQVYVVGYPHILPQEGTTFIPACSGIVFTGYGLTRIWDLTDSLNDVILDEVIDAGSQFHYVDTTVGFNGHELCKSDSYMNDLTVPLAYSLHPNEKGQEVYAEALRLAVS